MLDRLAGNETARSRLRRMIETGRVPGAMLFAGSAGVGKKLFAVELAKALNCLRPVNNVEACDVCGACVRIAALPQRLSAADPDALKSIVWSDHRDAGAIAPAGRFITVAQVREIERETQFRPVEGKRRVFLVDDADRLNEAASNALLKTLEEMPAAAHLVLLTSRPGALLPTIRSRCQMLRFAPLAPIEIETFLNDEKKRAGDEARLVARLAQGSLSRALTMNTDAYREQREQAFAIIEALAAQTPDRVRLLRVAEEMSDAKRKDEYEPTLDALETLLRDVWLLAIDSASEQIVNVDVLPRLTQLARRVERQKAQRGLTSIDELRRQLSVNINRRIATDALLLGMTMDA